MKIACIQSQQRVSYDPVAPGAWEPARIRALVGAPSHA